MAQILQIDGETMKTILLSGASGFIASNFRKQFHNEYRFILLSHTKNASSITLNELENNPELIRSIDIVINLAGANIGAKRWTTQRKQELLESRISTTKNLVSLFNEYNSEIHFISASAIGIYHPNQENKETESIDYSNYENFSQEITKKWETEALKFKGNLTITRFGVVLASNGGAFPQMLRPFLFGVGGKLGNGQQYFPWIALTDLQNALKHIIDNKLTGIYTLVAPELITNAELTKHIAQAWKRPAWFNLPQSVIRLIFGQMGQELFLNSIKISPDKLIASGFKFNYPSIAECLTAIKKQEF